MNELFAIISGGYTAVKKLLKDEQKIAWDYAKILAILSSICLGTASLIIYKTR